jgi:hypothetical protein
MPSVRRRNKSSGTLRRNEHDTALDPEASVLGVQLVGGKRTMKTLSHKWRLAPYILLIIFITALVFAMSKIYGG